MIDSKDTDGTYVILPAYNEAARLPAVLRTLSTTNCIVVVVDDGSDDDTAKIASKHDATVLRHRTNLGQGAALRTGIRHALSAGAGIIVTMDADGQHRGEEMTRVAGPIRRQECDVTLGSRFLGDAPGMPWTRWFLLKLAIVYTRLTTRITITDTHNGYRGFSRAAAERIRISEDRMAHATEILDQIGLQGLRYREVPVTVRYTHETLRKGQSVHDVLKLGWAVMRLRHTRGARWYRDLRARHSEPCVVND